MLNVTGNQVSANMNNPKPNNRSDVKPRIANELTAKRPASGFAKVAKIKPNCNVPTIGANATNVINRSAVSISGIVVKAIKTAPIENNGTMTQIPKIFGTLIPKVANAETKTAMNPSTNTIHT